MKAKDRRAVMLQLGCCLEEARMETARRTKTGQAESELLLLDMMKEFVSIIEEKPMMRQFWRFVFYRKS
jgi:hypothetical protein